MRTTKLIITNNLTNEWDVAFYENHRKCIALEIDTENDKIAKQYSAYLLIKKDLDLLLSWATKLEACVVEFELSINSEKSSDFAEIPDGHEEVQKKLFSLFTSIAIIYGRLFTSNKVRGLTLKTKKHILPQDIDIHLELMKIRDNYIGHSSDKQYEDSKAFVVINPVDSTQFEIVSHYMFIPFSSSVLTSEFINHFKNLSIDINNKINLLQNKLIKKYSMNNLSIKSVKQ